MHGKEPNKSTGYGELVTALSALAKPTSDVRSSAAVSRITSQSGGARDPIRDSSPQQNSTIRLLYVALFAGTAGEESETDDDEAGAASELC